MVDAFDWLSAEATTHGGRMLPLHLTLSALDLAFPGRHGAAILGVARKPA